MKIHELINTTLIYQFKWFKVEHYRIIARLICESFPIFYPLLLLNSYAIIKLKFKISSEIFFMILIFLITLLIYLFTPYSAASSLGANGFLLLKHNFRYSFPALSMFMILSCLLIDKASIKFSTFTITCILGLYICFVLT
jgi:hypothetical protein